MPDLISKRQTIVVLLVVCVMAMATFGVQADPARPAWRSDHMVYAQSGASNEQQAAKMAVRRHGGQVLRVEHRGKQYRVRLLMPNGRVKHVDIPASGPHG